MSTVEQTVALSPRQSEALSVFDAWVAEGQNGSYQEYVAENMEPKSDGSPITPNRAGVYVREALELAPDRSKDELPGGGRRGGGRRSKTPTANAALDAALAQFDRAIERLESRVTDAQDAVEAFDHTEYIDERTKVLEHNVKEAQAKLKAWKASADEQTKQANAELERLHTRVTQVADEVGNQLDEAKGERDKLVALIESMSA